MRCTLVLSALALTAMSAPVQAQYAFDCDGSPIPHLIDDLHPDAFRSFANGDIRIFALTVDSNLPSGVLIGILHPVPSDLAGAGPGQACTSVYNAKDESGYFGQVFLEDATAQYDPNAGLLVTIPVRQDYWHRPSTSGHLSLNVHQSDGSISAKLN